MCSSQVPFYCERAHKHVHARVCCVCVFVTQKSVKHWQMLHSLHVMTIGAQEPNLHNEMHSKLNVIRRDNSSTWRLHASTGARVEGRSI
jgi:hypothetical protein